MWKMNNNNLWTFIILINYSVSCWQRGVFANRVTNTKLHTLNLDHDLVHLRWLVDWHSEEVLFYLQDAFASGYKWFAFGWSRRGDFERSDLCIFQIENGVFKMALDVYTSDDGKFLYRDTQQDCEMSRIDEASVAFRRKFDTCDPQDLNMHEGTMFIIWSRGREPLDFITNRIETPAVAPHDQGMVMAQLLRADKIEIPEKWVDKIEIKLDNARIPAQETTYWCKIQKLNDIFVQKHHIVEFEPIITNEMLVHHMEVFHCETEAHVQIPLYEGDCNRLPDSAKVCSKVISLWAMGASTFTYPPEAGLPIGGADYNPFIRLEVHFNNPDKQANVVDSSGMRIKVVRTLRKFDAAVMELGLEYTDKMLIPPGQIGFPLSGHCIAECTDLALPRTGIIVFGSQLHTHLTGLRVLTRHFRDGEELQELNRDDYFSHHYQEIRQLRRKPRVLPGDALVTTCYYDTFDRTNVTLGGFSISDEMCVNYIHYYPATKLEVCKSSVSENTLADFFRYMARREQQLDVHENVGRSANFQAINWTEAHVDELYTMFTQEPLSMQCNRSDGHRFEGFNWEGAPITPVQLPIHTASCLNSNLRWMKPLAHGKCNILGECIY